MLYSYFSTSTMYQTSYHKLLPRQPPQPYGSIASPHPHTARQACKCTLSGPESRRFSLAQNDSFALPRGRGRCLRISHSTCEHRFCTLRLGSCEECCSNFELASDHRQLPLAHTRRFWLTCPSCN